MDGHEDPERNYLTEAYQILTGDTLLLTEREHLVALYRQLHPKADPTLEIPAVTMRDLVQTMRKAVGEALLERRDP